MIPSSIQPASSFRPCALLLLLLRTHTLSSHVTLSQPMAYRGIKIFLLLFLRNEKEEERERRRRQRQLRRRQAARPSSGGSCGGVGWLQEVERRERRPNCSIGRHAMPCHATTPTKQASNAAASKNKKKLGGAIHMRSVLNGRNSLLRWKNVAPFRLSIKQTIQWDSPAIYFICQQVKVVALCGGSSACSKLSSYFALLTALTSQDAETMDRRLLIGFYDIPNRLFRSTKSGRLLVDEYYEDQSSCSPKRLRQKKCMLQILFRRGNDGLWRSGPGDSGINWLKNNGGAGWLG
jgi:hypothetical protein